VHRRLVGKSGDIKLIAYSAEPIRCILRNIPLGNNGD